jgi:branched-chain amino acid aminotransferase
MKFPISIELTDHSRLAETDFNNLPFGKTFSDHMFVADYEDGEWKNCRIVPYGPLPMTPANMAIHYGQAVFEGMKANKHAKTGEPILFRPDMHLQRLNRSTDRLGMPEIPEELFYSALNTLISLDKDWIPQQPGSALYIRPVVFAADEFLGVRASETYKFVILTGPTGPYYPKPVRLKVAERFVRAFKGGVGFAKAAGNYGATIQPAKIAREQGFDQMLWMDGVEFKYLQECGTMNIFVVIDGKVLTPPLGDTILAGITRDSIIHLLSDKGYTVEERPITIDEVVEAHRQGRLQEMFGTGTAAVVSHVAAFGYKGEMFELGPVEERKIGNYAKENIEAIKEGSVEDPYGWLSPVQQQSLV